MKYKQFKNNIMKQIKSKAKQSKAKNEVEILTTTLNEFLNEVESSETFTELSEKEISELSIKELETYFEELESNEAEEYLETVGITKVLGNIKYSYKYQVLGEIMKAKTISSFDLYDVINPKGMGINYDCKGFMRDVNTAKGKILKNRINNKLNGNKELAETIPRIYETNVEIEENLKESYFKPIDKLWNEEKETFIIPETSTLKLRECFRNKAIRDAVKEFKSTKILVRFSTNESESRTIRDNKGIPKTYAHNNYITIIAGKELLKAYLLTYGATLKDLI